MCVHGDNSRSIEKLLVSDMDAQPSIHTHIQLYMGSSSVPHDRSTATAPSPYGIYISNTSDLSSGVNNRKKGIGYTDWPYCRRMPAPHTL